MRFQRQERARPKPTLDRSCYTFKMADFLEEQAKRLYGLGDLEAEALEVLRLVVRQTERGENLDADLVERAKSIVERYDRAMTKGHEAPGVVPLRRDSS